MTNETRLHKIITFVSEKIQEQGEKVAKPLYGGLTKNDYDNIIRMHYLFDIALKIIWLCEDILQSDPDIEDREPLKIELLMTRLYEPYSRTLSYFYSYLSDWRANFIPSVLRKQAPIQAPTHYFCDELQYRFDLDYEA